MTRIIVFLVLLTAIALGGAWFADQPGDVAITWLGRRIEMSVFTLAALILAIVVVAMLLWSVARMIMRTPDIITMMFRNRRRDRLMQAQTLGLLAVGSGDLRLAERQASEARRIDADAPLTLLLAAQTAQMRGDRGEADRAFKAMLGHEETRALGLRGLFIEARRRDDSAAARDYATRALTDGRPAAWAGTAMLEQQTIDSDWEGALATLETNIRSGIVDRDVGRRQRAVLLTARALSEGVLDDQALALALEAHKLAPDLVPATVRAAQILASQGHVRRVVKLVEQTWKITPHPDLADIYLHARLGDSALDRLGRAETLARLTPDDPEGSLAIARAAIDAGEFVRARAVLEPLVEAPTGRVCLLMAKLEQDVSGDLAKARGWLARAVNAAADPAWTADGYVSDRWLPASPLTGRLDAFVWKVPLAPLGEGSRLSYIDAVIADVDEPMVDALPEPAPALPPAATSVAPKPANDTVPIATPAGADAKQPLPAPLAEIRDRLAQDAKPALAGEPAEPPVGDPVKPPPPREPPVQDPREAPVRDPVPSDVPVTPPGPGNEPVRDPPPGNAALVPAAKPAAMSAELVKTDNVAKDGVAKDGVVRDGVARDGVVRTDGTGKTGPVRPLPAVFPLAHAPDDPGLDGTPAEPKQRFKIFGA